MMLCIFLYLFILILFIPGLGKVISLTKLRTDHKRYEDRRNLCNAYDLFLCDDRITPMLPKVIGKVLK